MSIFFRWTSSLECAASQTQIHQLSPKTLASDVTRPTILDLHFNIVSPTQWHSLRFRFHCFIACLIRCTALLGISVYFCYYMYYYYYCCCCCRRRCCCCCTVTVLKFMSRMHFVIIASKDGYDDIILSNRCIVS